MHSLKRRGLHKTLLFKMFAGFIGEAGHAGPLEKRLALQMGGYCLLTEADSFQSRAVGALFDGELDNQEELAKELDIPHVKDGAELICKGYEDFGEAFFAKLSGAFMLALIDEASGAAYLHRSSNELRPIYWQREKSASMRHSFSFATSLKTWCRLNRRAWNLDRSGLSAFLHLGFFPDFFTPISGLDRLLPGYLLRRDVRGFTLKQVASPLYKSTSPTIKKLPKIDRTFSLQDLSNQVWQLDMPLAKLFVPALFEHKLKLVLPKPGKDQPDSIYYNTPTLLKKRFVSRLFQVGTRPFTHPFWFTRRLKERMSAFEKHASLFTYSALKAIAPRICRYFHFPAFTTKIIHRHTGPTTFLDHEAIHMAYAFDAGSSESISYKTLLGAPSLFDQYIPDEKLETIYTFLECGALCDQDIIHKEALREAPLSKMQLWSLAQLEMWMRLFYEEAPTEEHRRAVEANFLVESAARLLKP